MIDASVSPVTVTSIPTEAGSTAVAVNPVTNKIYVANGQSNSVTVIDASVAPATTTTVAVSSNPLAIAVDPVTNKAYVANYRSDNVSVIDASNTVTKVAVGTSPSSIAVNPVTGNVYVGNQATSNVTVIGPQAKTIRVGKTPRAIAVNPQTNHIYVANSLDNTVTVIDGASSSVLLTQSVGTFPGAIGIDPVNGRVAVANYNSASVTILNDVFNGEVKILSTGQYEPFATIVNPTFHKAYVVNVAAGTLTVINTNDDTYTTSSTVMTNPIRLATDLSTGYVFVLAAGGYDPNVGGIWVFDSNGTALVSAPIPFVATYGPQPSGSIAVDSVTHSVYATSELFDNTSIIQIDGSAPPFAVIGYPFQSSGCPSCVSSTYVIAINPDNHKVYVGARDSADLWIFDGATPNGLASYITKLSGFPPGAIRAMRINNTTNKVYLSGINSGIVEIDGAADTITKTIDSGSLNNLWAMAVNEVTNQVFVGSLSAPSFATIDVDNNYTLTTWPICGSDAQRVTSAMDVDTMTNVIYVTHDSAPYITALGGINPSSCSDIAVGSVNHDLAIDPETHKVYVPNNASSNVSIVNIESRQTEPAVTITPVVDPKLVRTSPFITKNPTPSFTVTVTSPSGYPDITTLYYFVDAFTPLASVSPTSSSGGVATFQITTQILSVNGHVLTVYPAYGNEAGNNSGEQGTGNSPDLGSITPLAFTVTEDAGATVATTTSVKATPNPQNSNSPVAITARVVPSSGEHGPPTGTVTFVIDGVSQSPVLVTATGSVAVLTYAFTTGGLHTITANYSGDASFLASSGNTTVTIAGAATSIVAVEGDGQIVTYGQPLSLLVANVVDSSNVPVSGVSVTITGSVGSNLSFSRSSGTTGSTGTVSTTPTQTPQTAGTIGASASAAGVPTPAHFLIQVIQAPLTVTTNATRLYGQPDPQFVPTYTGFVNGDSASVVSGTPAVTPASTINSPVGSYPLSVGLGTLAASNYTITPANGVMTIVQAPTRVVLTAPSTAAYGDRVRLSAVLAFDPTPAQGPTGTVSFFDGSSLLANINVDNSSFGAVFDTTSFQTGVHSITAVYNGDGNWTTSTGSASITITPQTPGLTVTVNDVTRSASDSNPTFSYTVTGDFVNGDTADTAVSGGTFSAYTGSTPGTYPITVTGVVSPNYALTLVPGTLTVTNDTGSSTTTVLTATPSSSMYGDLVTLKATVSAGNSGPPAISGAIALYEGLTLLGQGTITNGAATVATTKFSAGSHSLVAVYIGDATYSSSRSNIVTVTVAKKQAPGGGPVLTLTVQDASRAYGEANPAFSYIPAGALVNGDTYDTAISGVPVYQTTATFSSPVGINYPVTLTGVSSRNYEITTVPGNLVILRSSLQRRRRLSLPVLPQLNMEILLPSPQR